MQVEHILRGGVQHRARVHRLPLVHPLRQRRHRRLRVALRRLVPSRVMPAPGFHRRPNRRHLLRLEHGPDPATPVVEFTQHGEDGVHLALHREGRVDGGGCGETGQRVSVRLDVSPDRGAVVMQIRVVRERAGLIPAGARSTFFGVIVRLERLRELGLVRRALREKGTHVRGAHLIPRVAVSEIQLGRRLGVHHGLRHEALLLLRARRRLGLGEGAAEHGHGLEGLEVGTALEHRLVTVFGPLEVALLPQELREAVPGAVQRGVELGRLLQSLLRARERRGAVVGGCVADHLLESTAEEERARAIGRGRAGSLHIRGRREHLDEERRERVARLLRGRQLRPVGRALVRFD